MLLLSKLLRLARMTLPLMLLLLLLSHKLLLLRIDHSHSWILLYRRLTLHDHLRTRRWLTKNLIARMHLTWYALSDHMWWQRGSEVLTSLHHSRTHWLWTNYTLGSWHSNLLAIRWIKPGPHHLVMLHMLVSFRSHTNRRIL